MGKEELPIPFIKRLEHVDEDGLISNIQFWTGARRNSVSSFIYKGLYCVIGVLNSIESGRIVWTG